MGTWHRDEQNRGIDICLAQVLIGFLMITSTVSSEIFYTFGGRKAIWSRPTRLRAVPSPYRGALATWAGMWGPSSFAR